MKTIICAIALAASCTSALADSYVFRVSVPKLAATPSGGGGGAAKLVMSASSLEFGDILNNTLSSAKKVTVKNSGTSETPLAIQVAGDYAATSQTTCGATLAAGAQCGVEVVFAPAGAGQSKSGSLSVSSATGVAQVALSGASFLSSSSVLVATPYAMPPSRVLIPGGSTLADYMTVKVEGTAPVQFGERPSFAGADGTEFRASTAGVGMCIGLVAAGTTCKVGLAFRPTQVGTYTRTAVLNVPNNGTDRYGRAGPQSISIKIEGTVLEFARLLYGSGTVESPATWTTNSLGMSLLNSGNLELTVTGFTVSHPSAPGGSVQVTGMCDKIAPKGSCGITLTTTNFPVGVHNIVLTVNSDSHAGTAYYYFQRVVQ
jgi:hypothetical protein